MTCKNVQTQTNWEIEMSFETHNDLIESELEPAVPGPIESSLLVEQETIGDWAGHTPTPTIDAEIELGRLQQEADSRMDQKHRQLIDFGIKSLIEISGRNSRDHGFHDDFPVDPVTATGETAGWIEYQKTLALAVTQKLMLMQEEIIEAFGEIRSGRSTGEIYFVDKKGLVGGIGGEHEMQAYGCFVEGELAAYVFGEPKGDMTVPLLKPEGFIVEIADLFIRGADLMYLLRESGNFAYALEIKHEYNSTRPFKHGRQF
jgi:hypothetical protein